MDEILLAKTDLEKEHYNKQIAKYVMDAVALYYEMGAETYKLKTRQRNIVSLKHTCAYMLTQHTSLTFQQIGRYVELDHSTVIYAKKKINGFLTYDKDYRQEIEELSEIIRQGKLSIINGLDIRKDYYYIDLNNFVSVRKNRGTAMLVTGFSKEEVKHFSLIDSRTGHVVISGKNAFSHKNRKMYVLEKIKGNEETKQKQNEKDNNRSKGV